MRFLLSVFCFALCGCQSLPREAAKDANLDKPMSSGEREITEILNVGLYTIEIKNWPRLAENVNGEPAAGILTVKRYGFSRSMKKVGYQFTFQKKLDLTGDSKEDFVFTTWSGGAHGISDLVIFDSKIEKFHVFFFSDWLGTNNEYLKDYFEEETPFAFHDINDDKIPELLILYPWPYYITDFFSSPQDLKVYSLKGSKVRDITSKCKGFMKKAIIGETVRYINTMKEGNWLRSWSINVSILLMKLSAGFSAEEAWMTYEANYEGIYKALHPNKTERNAKNTFDRQRLEKDRAEYAEKYEPHIE